MEGRAVQAADGGAAQVRRPQQPRPHHGVAPRRRQQAAVPPGAVLHQSLECAGRCGSFCVSSATLDVRAAHFEAIASRLCHGCTSLRRAVLHDVLSKDMRKGIGRIGHRQVDFQRAAVEGTGVVERLEYDPNRSARIALVRYPVGASVPPAAFTSQRCLHGAPSASSAACRVHDAHVHTPRA